ncbi:MAG TPA: RNB domain-containing ribonuclease, partial [Candidatus Polarisedimenticolaceae bacterium]|nr:RNB domain-containing ribonuclease [Candidatus Polarisedimenticolaceae bacterium]
GEDRVALVIEVEVGPDGTVAKGEVYRASVHNRAKLAYNSLGMWLEGQAEPPDKVRTVPGLAENLKLQDRTADRMRALRHEHGALDLETIEPRAVLQNGQVVDLKAEARNNAKNLIEDFMIAANGVTARYLRGKRFPSVRRVVRVPQRWDRIVAIAEELGEHLPHEPDPIALEQFLARRRKDDPLRFPDLSLAIVKALGAGEYVLEEPGQRSIGHFGLAVRDYAHSTAPNRRFPDLITHRLLKAALGGGKLPYTSEELAELARHCTEAEDAANKVERKVRKAAAACLLEGRIGEKFEGLVTGASEKGTWVRVFQPPVEGKVVQGSRGLDIGQKVRVKLIAVDVEKGFIDFARAHR